MRVGDRVWAVLRTAPKLDVVVQISGGTALVGGHRYNINTGARLGDPRGFIVADGTPEALALTERYRRVKQATEAYQDCVNRVRTACRRKASGG